jgi:hypothetical protein
MYFEKGLKNEIDWSFVSKKMQTKSDQQCYFRYKQLVKDEDLPAKKIGGYRFVAKDGKEVMTMKYHDRDWLP